jgi:hypothetical protein
MSTTQLDNHAATEASRPGGAATEASEAASGPMRLEAVVVPVADVDRANRFYRRLGWRVDAGGGPGGGFIAGTEARAAGRDPEDRSYATYASFSDPDGNRWLLQEITERAPGRV